METQRLSVRGGALLWFGAAVSLAEIWTGALLAPLGLWLGLWVILLGHLIGGVGLFLVGYLGAKRNLGAMESAALAFGPSGARFFAGLNLLQLLGWTAVMIANGGLALGTAAGGGSYALWCLLVGAGVLLWVLVGLGRLEKLGALAAGGLLLLSAALFFVIFRGWSGTVALPTEGLSFGLALELSIAMPISWLPLLADYTKGSKRPLALTLGSCLAYLFGSALMYALGLVAALYTGSGDVVAILLAAGLGLPAMAIVLLSTVTTTFLDVYSAGESARLCLGLSGPTGEPSTGKADGEAAGKKPWASPRLLGVFCCLLGTLLALGATPSRYEGFLTLIGSVFVPMAVILAAEGFLGAGGRLSKRGLWVNGLLWALGFLCYRLFLTLEIPLGSTIPAVGCTLVLWLLAKRFVKGRVAA